MYQSPTLKFNSFSIAIVNTQYWVSLSKISDFSISTWIS